MSRPRPRVQGNTNARLLTSKEQPEAVGRDTAGGDTNVVPKRLARGAKQAGQLEHRALAARRAMKTKTGQIYRLNNANAVACGGGLDPATEVE